MSSRCLQAHLLATYLIPIENICRPTLQTHAELFAKVQKGSEGGFSSLLQVQQLCFRSKAVGE